MICEQARAVVVDTATGNATPNEQSAVRAHLETCAPCRAFAAELDWLWQGLGTLPIPAPAPDAERQFKRALSVAAALGQRPTVVDTRRGASGQGTRTRPDWGRRTAVAALLVGAFLGYATASWQGGSGSTTPAAPASPATTRAGDGMYLLLLYTDANAGAAGNAHTEARIVAEYARWARALRDSGKLVSAEKLADSPSRWLGPGSPAGVVPNVGQIGGFFLIRAADFAEAQRIAADCPHLKHGGRVELRAIEPT